MTFFDDIKDFHEKFELVYDGKPRALPKDLDRFRIDFLKEEFSEYTFSHENAQILQKCKEEIYFDHLELCLDGLVDMVYVILGTAYLHGFDFDEAWKRVHQANMKKVRAVGPGESKRNSTYDVIKPPDWQPPYLKDLVK